MTCICFLFDFAITPNKALFLRAQESAVISFVFNYIYRDWGALILGISLSFLFILFAKNQATRFMFVFFFNARDYMKDISTI